MPHAYSSGLGHMPLHTWDRVPPMPGEHARCCNPRGFSRGTEKQYIYIYMCLYPKIYTLHCTLLNHKIRSLHCTLDQPGRCQKFIFFNHFFKNRGSRLEFGICKQTCKEKISLKKFEKNPLQKKFKNENPN